MVDLSFSVLDCYIFSPGNSTGIVCYLLKFLKLIRTQQKCTNTTKHLELSFSKRIFWFFFVIPRSIALFGPPIIGPWNTRVLVYVNRKRPIDAISAGPSPGPVNQKAAFQSRGKKNSFHVNRVHTGVFLFRKFELSKRYKNKNRIQNGIRTVGPVFMNNMVNEKPFFFDFLYSVDLKIMNWWAKPKETGRILTNRFVTAKHRRAPACRKFFCVFRTNIEKVVNK